MGTSRLSKPLFYLKAKCGGATQVPIWYRAYLETEPTLAVGERKFKQCSPANQRHVGAESVPKAKSGNPLGGGSGRLAPYRFSSPYLPPSA